MEPERVLPVVEGQLRCRWTHKGEDPSPLEKAGTCVVNVNVLTRATSLFGEG